MSTPPIQTDLPYWRLPIADLLAKLSASPNGLSNGEAATRLDRFGPNVVSAERKRAVVLQFLSKFLNPLVIILLVASGIAGATGDKASFFIISAIVLISVTLDFVQEHRAGQAAERLRDSVAVQAKVLREERTVNLPLAAIVPGDVALLAAGDMIPGDGRVLEAKDLFLNESLLTGEPFPVEKTVTELPDQSEVLRAGNSVFMGTSVISGTAKVLVCRTGQGTSLGEIADTLNKASADATDTTQSYSLSNLAAQFSNAAATGSLTAVSTARTGGSLRGYGTSGNLVSSYLSQGLDPDMFSAVNTMVTSKLDAVLSDSSQ